MNEQQIRELAETAFRRPALEEVELAGPEPSGPDHSYIGRRRGIDKAAVQRRDGQMPSHRHLQIGGI